MPCKARPHLKNVAEGDSSRKRAKRCLHLTRSMFVKHRTHKGPRPEARPRSMAAFYYFKAAVSDLIFHYSAKQNIPTERCKKQKTPPQKFPTKKYCKKLQKHFLTIFPPASHEAPPSEFLAFPPAAPISIRPPVAPIPRRRRETRACARCDG